MATEDNLQTIWSTFIQRPEMLYRTRAIRFRDENKERILNASGFKDGMSILEVGCGPGAFCHALERWLPGSQITGLDRDSVFIEYATKKSRELNSKCRFIVGDATNLEFLDDTFDATTSNTVVEHVETTSFLAEQYRVLKTGGVCTVLSVRSSLPVRQDPWTNGSEEEKALWDKVEPYFKASDQKYGVAKYAINETELPKKMIEAGFHDVAIDFLVVTNVPDSADVDFALGRAMIEVGRQGALDALAVAQALAPDVWSAAEAECLHSLINSRFDERIQLYETGKKVWDVSASVVMVGRGIKS